MLSSSHHKSSNAGDEAGKAITINGISFSFSYFQYTGNPNVITDPGLKLLCKSLLKKDTKTKIRALTKISEFFDETEDADFYSFMSFYGEAYPKLAINNDKSLRSASHKVIQVLVAKYGRKYAFYLKNVIPIWLMGIYDPEKVVAYEVKKLLSNTFPKEKLENLYSIFQNEIFELIIFFINNETPETLYDTFSETVADDASLIYSRTLAVMLRLLTYIISNDLVKEESKSGITSLLADKSNKLWLHLTSNISNPNYIILKQSLLQLAINCFTHKVKLSSSTIFKQIFKLIKQMPKNQDLIPSLINLIVVLLIHLNLSSLKGDLLDKFKMAFYNILPFAAQIDFYEFLAVLVNKSDIIDYSNALEFKSFTSIFANNRNPIIFEQYVKFIEILFSKFYDNTECNIDELTNELCQNILDNKVNPKFAALLNKFDATEAVVINLYESIYLNNYILLLERLDNKKIQTLALYDLIIRFLPNSTLLDSQDNIMLENYLPNTAIEYNNNNDNNNISSFLRIVELLTKAPEIKSNLKFLLLHNFFYHSFNGYLESGNLSILLKIFSNLDKDVFIIENLNSLSIIERADEVVDFVNVSDSLEIKNDFKIFLSKFPNLNINLGASKELRNFIHDYLILGSEASFDAAFRDVLKICFKFANDIGTLSILYIRILDSEIQKSDQLLRFWDEYFCSDSLIEIFPAFNRKVKSLSGSESVFTFFWHNITKRTIEIHLSKIENLFANNTGDELFNSYFSTLCESLQQLDKETSRGLLEYFKHKVDIIFPEEKDVHVIITNLYDINDAISLACIDDSLGKYVYFMRDCSKGETKFKFEKVSHLIHWVDLLLRVDTYSNDLMVMINVLCLFINDYLFFHNDFSKELDNFEKMVLVEETEDLLFSVKSKAFKSMTVGFEAEVSFADMIFSDEERKNGVIKLIHNKLESSLSDIVKFYYAKLYREILNFMSSKFSETLVAESACKEINNKFIKPKKLIETLALIPFYENIIETKDLDYFKKMIISNVIGFGKLNSDNLAEFFVTLELLNKALAMKSDSIIPGIQLDMVVRRFKQMLDEDIAYDLEFIPIRINILTFFNTYLRQYGFSSLEHQLEFIISDLYINTLSIVSNSEIDTEFDNECEKQESVSYELSLIINLNITCLRFFSFLQTTKNDNNFLIKEIAEEITEELVKSMLGIFRNKYLSRFLINQGLLLNVAFYKKLFKTSILSIEILKEHYDSLVESYSFIKNRYNFKLIEFKRFMVFIIGELTNMISRDTVIELALNITSLSKNEDILDQMFKIPQVFISIISDTSGILDYIEYESLNSLYDYLWSWMQIFKCFSENMPSFLQKKYIGQLPENSIETLLNIIFEQIDVSKDELFSLKNEDWLVLEIKHYDVFSPSSSCGLREIKIILLHLYYTILIKFRFKANEWFKDLRNVPAKAKIENFTEKYISPAIIEDLMKDLQNILIKNQENEQFKDGKEAPTKDGEEDFNYDDLHTVKFSKATHEIRSQYVVDEERTEISFKVPRLFPLSNIIVNAPSRMAVKEVTWQSWILQCQNLMNKINNSNATQSASSLIFDAVDLFDKNFRLHFKGFQECAICYSILDAYDKTLPNKTCHTCHNKFHGACLLKWFKSSGDYSCPLCRCKFQLHLKR